MRTNDGVSKVKTKKEYKKSLKKARMLVYFLFILGVLVFLGLIAFAILKQGLNNFINTINSFNPSYFLVAVVLAFGGSSLRFFKWEIFTQKLGIKIARFKNYLIYLSLNSMNVTPGRSGRLIASYTLNKVTGTSYGRTSAAVVADIFTDFIGYIIITISIAFLVGRYLLLSITIAALLVVPFLILYNDKLFRLAKSYFSKRGRFGKFFEFGENYYKSLKFLGSKVYLKSLIYTIPSELMSATALYVVLLGFGVPLTINSLPLIFFIYTSAILFGTVSGIPGAIGVADIGIFGYLILLLGLNYAIASTVTVIFEIANLWFGELVGFAALAYTTHRWD